MVSMSGTPDSRREPFTLWLTTQPDYILYRKSFSSAVRNVKVIPNKKCIQQHHMVVCEFTTYTPHVKKHKFSPHFHTWKLSDPVAASQFQPAFQLKWRLPWLQLPLLQVLLLILQIALRQFGQSWRTLCWMLPPKSAVSLRTTSADLKPGGGMKRWKQLY